MGVGGVKESMRAKDIQVGMCCCSVVWVCLGVYGGGWLEAMRAKDI